MLQASLKQVQGQPKLHSEIFVSNQPNNKESFVGGGSEIAQQGKHLLCKPTDLTGSWDPHKGGKRRLTPLTSTWVYHDACILHFI